jgi:orotidine-5'-phosphate decarboxylase
MTAFSDRLLAKVAAVGHPLCVGIDPNFSLMPAQFWPKDSSSSSVQQALLAFCATVIDAVRDQVAVVKFQAAFFEACGTAGMLALAEAVTLAKKAGLLVIMDAKRGDIGSTATAYASAYLGGDYLGGSLPNGVTVGSDLVSDALTVSPFLGGDTLEPLIGIAAGQGKGLFVLVKTSNPGSGDWQDVLLAQGDPASNTAPSPLNHVLAKQLAGTGAALLGQHSGFSGLGAVVGATYPPQAAALRALMPRALFLIPGVGAQGGSLGDALAGFAKDANGQPTGAIVSLSRQITYPSGDEVRAQGFAGAVRQRLSNVIAEWQRVVQPAIL